MPGAGKPIETESEEAGETNGSGFLFEVMKILKN